MNQKTKEITRQLHDEGLALSSLGKHKEALAKFEKIIKINDRDNFAWHRKGIELNSLNKYKEAMECFDRAIVINHNDRFAWNHRGVSLRELERYDEALRSCNKAIKINNKYPFGWYTKGSILQHLGDYAGAKDCFERVVKLAPDNDMYRKRLEGIKELIQQLELENQIEKPKMVKDWITDQKWRDIKYQDLPDWVKRRVKELDHHPLTGKSFEYRREPATGGYQRRLRRPPNTSELHRRGITHHKLGEYEQAIACFDEAIRINEMDHTAWHRKGISLNALAKYNEAMKCFEKAIRINPRDKFAWNHRALSLCRLGNYKDAITSCNEAIKIDDTYPLAWRNRAIIEAHLEDFEDFEKSYRKARQLDPKGLNNQFFAEYLPKIEYKDFLSRSKGDVNRSGLGYLAKLCLVYLQIDDIPDALKCAMDLRNYVTTVEVKNKLDQLIDELEFRRKEGISVTKELVERAGVVLH